MNNHEVEYNAPFSSEYQLPSTELLNSYECDGEVYINEDEVNGIKDHIEEIFHTLKVPIYGMRIDIAPAVIRFVIITWANIRATFVRNVARAIELFLNGKRKHRTRLDQSRPSLRGSRTLRCRNTNGFRQHAPTTIQSRIQPCRKVDGAIGIGWHRHVSA